MSLAANTKLGPYVVLGPLKSGGMGEVYRAHDPQLDRTVALKVMKAEMVGDASAVARFQREAKLASSLNHPHIISIFSTHETDGLICLAMELVEGEPLSDWQKNHKPSLGHLLEVFVQIADALAAAHAAGVIHRDLKPSNILVNRQGYAKILDFGLAKQVVPAGGEASQLTTDTYLTGARDVLGTPAYMSPEQAQGLAVDARTDIFSLGVVLYEAVTGVRPFAGDSVVQLLHEVITKQPRPAREIKPALPPEIEWILERAMAKQPLDRYGAMAEFAAELRRLRAKSEGEASGIRRPESAPAKWVWVAVAAVIFLGAGSLWMLRDRFMKPKSLQVRYEQLTDFNDAAAAPALSPDGRMLAFVRGGFFGGSAAAGEIYVKMLPDGDPIRLTNDGMSKHTPVFSPDGTRVLFTRIDKNFTWDTWQVPVLGGEATPYLPNASGLTFLSKDEIMFAEIRKSPHMGVMTSRLNRIGQREIYMPPGEGSMAHRASLSPDRTWVLLAEMDGSGWLPCRIVPFDGSSAGRQVGPLEGQCTTVAWSPDGKWMYFSSNAGGGFHIWRQAFPDGTPERVTSESNEQEGTALAPDGKSLVTSAGTAQSAIWIHDKQGDRQLTSQGVAILPTISPDGGAVYFLQRGGTSRSYISGELWRLDLKSGNKERVLPGVFMAMYDLSPDGRRVVFTSAEGGSEPGIWVADLDRLKPPQQLTKGGEFRAFFAGNEEIVFLSNGKERFLYSMKTDGSAKRQISNTPVIYLINVSPDGEWAAVAVPDPAGTVVKLFPVRRDAVVVQICHGCAVGFGPARQDAPVVNWTPDGRSVMVPMRFFGMSRKTIILPFDPEHPDFDREARSETEYRALPGARIADDRGVFPATRPDEYLMSRRSATSNLFRVILPD